jgi:hypothetical protein
LIPPRFTIGKGVFGLKKRESAIICNIYGDNGEIITIITMYLAVLNKRNSNSVGFVVLCDGIG